MEKIGLKLFLFMLFLVSSLDSYAYVNNLSFWKKRTLQLKYSTATQTVLSGNCSGVMTVRTYSPDGILKSVTSPLTVGLTGPGTTTFYSDSTCTFPITDLTIATGSSTGSFYFIDSSTGTKTIVAAATDYASATQNETINTNGFVWTGGGGNALWATGANWSGGVAPNSSQRALFNETCVSNCSPTISANTSVAGIRLTAGYSGTITQSNGFTLTIGVGGWSQQNGNFLGGDSNIVITDAMTLRAGSFRSTSAMMHFQSIDFIKSAGATFNHNNGLVYIQGSTLNISGAFAFYNLDFYGFGSSDLTGTVDVTNLRFLYAGYTTTLSGTNTINVSGNLEVQVQWWTVSTTSLIRMVGTGTVTGGTTSSIGSFEIATAGTITFAPTGNFNFAGNFTYTAGTIVSTGSTIRATGSIQTFNTGAMPLHHFTIDSSDNNCTFTVVGSMNILGDLTITAGSYSSRLDGGTLNVSGNINILSTSFYRGNALVRMVGTGTITGSGTGSALPGLEIATSGTVTFAPTGSIDVNNRFTYTSGTVITTNSHVRLRGDSPITFEPGSMRFNHLSLYQANAPTNVTGTVYVDGDLSLRNGGGTLCKTEGGNYEVKGNLIMYGWYGGSSELFLTGTSSQTITSTGGSRPPGTLITLNSASSVLTLTSTITTTNFVGINVLAGNLDMAGFGLTTKSLALNTNTLTKNGGVLTVNGVVAGTGSLYGGTVNP
jgi:hypothetical protein